MNAIECISVTKSFGGTTVVDQVDVEVRAGTVHSLVGANGAGKSTLLGMMSGRLSATDGTVSIFGERLHGGDPKESRRAGLSAVYQELTVLPALTTVANVFLGQEMSRQGLLREKDMVAAFLELSRDLGLEFDPKMKAGDLSVAAAQMLEIMRAVHASSRVILFDEPTAALSERERRVFLDLVRKLKARGTTIVLVTHNLSEVLEVSDDITVMRSGRKVAFGPASEWTKASLVREMTGETIAPEPRSRQRVEFGRELLAVEQLTLPGAIEDVTLRVRAGEVVGLAGLVGSGRSSILRSLAGDEPHAKGRLRVRGREQKLPRSVRQAIQSLGIGLVPEERKTEGLVLGMSVPDNVTLADLTSVSRRGLVNASRQLEVAKTKLEELTLSRPVGDYPVSWLSGGNQQKVALAKWLHRDPDILLVDEPTRGIDVAAKVDVLSALRALASSGKGVIVTSAEIDEVLDVSDTVLVVAGGRIVAEFDTHRHEPTVKDVLDLAFGVNHEF
ncbi:sugar ABC transporter ATP-binding protein [Rhodococcus sp. NPDC059968]|uniref:sugar ABC transporter ATP-binding protein n=1 Tax=Rhodococcus sp. NPDC059968 TaxID=3347017 RepID=UPI00366B7C69